ncbi:MATE family efflux transporter [Merdimmobilis hominis]|uniref:MATE family efflux transporter n=1 Tax=Merdimmobilis hominis TaxID=2897707 RepID=UPI00280599F0|nr:MATE family efflux transporter [uncultured Merdimmobilis sp.]
MSILVRDQTFYKKLGAIAIPIMLQNLITFGVSMMDTLMLGRLGEVQMSAAALANQLFYMLMVIGFGIANGSNVLIAQYWGRGDTEKIRSILSVMYKVVLVVGLTFSAVALFAPGAVMSFFTTDEAVIAEGIKYLKIMGWVAVFYAMTTSTACMFRSVGSVTIAVLVNATSLVVNTSLNWVLIFGHLGFPALGISGAAIATAISRTLEFVIMMTYLLVKDQKIGFRLKNLGGWDRDIAHRFVGTAAPVVFNEVLWSSGAITVTMIIGRMGTEFVAANSIYSVVNQLATVAIFGLSNASAAVIGHTIGEGEPIKAQERAKTLLAMGLGIGLIASAIVFFARPIVINFYNVSEVTKGYAYDIMGVGSLIIVFLALSSVSMMGVLRGGGDVKFVLFMDVFFMWVVAIPLGYLAGLVWKLPVLVVYLILKCDEILKSTFACIRVLRGRWVRDVTL